MWASEHESHKQEASWRQDKQIISPARKIALPAPFNWKTEADWFHNFFIIWPDCPFIDYYPWSCFVWNRQLFNGSVYACRKKTVVMTGQNTSYIIVQIDEKDFMPFLMIFCQIKSNWNALTIFDNMDIKFFKSCACSITNCFMVIWKPIFCKVLNEMFKKKWIYK